VKVRIQTGTGISGCIRYARGEGLDPKTGLKKELGPEEESRVVWFAGSGFGFAINTDSRLETARKLMEFDVRHQPGKTRPCKQACVHISLAWERGEQAPTREEIEAAVQGALASLGMDNAQALFFVHGDEDYPHVHIVASKLNPETGFAYDLLASQRKLSVWAEEYERAHGGIVTTGRETANELRRAIAARDAAGVLEALTKQRSTFTQQQLARSLEKEIYWKIGASAGEKRAVEEERARFAQHILAHPEVLRLAEKEGEPTTRYTTRAVWEAEQYVLNAAAELHASDRHQVPVRELARVITSSRYKDITKEQAIALRHATGAQGLALIDGMAGTGKSFVMAAIRDAYEGAGHRVIGLGPTNKVARSMAADGFGHAKTIHSELFALNNARTNWNGKTVVMVDEAAMVDTKLMAMVAAHAHDPDAKLILVGDDRQLSSVDRGGMFGSLKQRYGAAELTKVIRQYKNDDRRASEMMSEGNFDGALRIYEQQGRIHWTTTQRAARAELVEQWAGDSAAHPDQTAFVFAYTNLDVDRLNAAVRAARKESGELQGGDHALMTAHGRASFTAGDRIQFTGTDKNAGFTNGEAGIIEAIDGAHIAVRLDGAAGKTINFNAASNPTFRHGYAGTIYKGQGVTLDRTYLFHSEHWRAAPSYVALTRHREETAIFVARNTAKDLATLAKQIGRPDDRRAATQFYCQDDIAPVPPKTAAEILARLSDPAFERGQREAGEGGEGDPVTAATGQRFHRQDNAAPEAAKETGRDRAVEDADSPSTPDERQAERHTGIRAAIRKARAILRRLRPRKAASGGDQTTDDTGNAAEDADETDEQVNDAAEGVEAGEAEAPGAPPDTGEAEAVKKPATPEMDAYLAALLAEAEVLREREPEEAERPEVVRQRARGRGRTM
jgi:ATP-dependent exoDNAse (exonuclease V) alpha subunit